MDAEVEKEPWALRDPELTMQFIEKDLRAGHLFKLPGGEAEARKLWGDNVAAGKFGVAAEGRKPRLVGDGTISGTKAASQIGEKVRLPHLENVQQFLSRAPEEQQCARCAQAGSSAL